LVFVMAVEPVLLTGGDVFNGERLLRDCDVLLEDGLIAAVGPSLLGPGAHSIDCRGRTVLPGLIDAHVHIAWAGMEPPAMDVASGLTRSTHNARLLLEFGVTTARDTGGPLGVLGALSAALDRGEVTGPQLLHSGHILCAPGGHGTEFELPVPMARECSGPDGFRAGVRENIAGGASVIKVALNGADGRVQLDEDELVAAVDEAHAAGVRVACHASVHDAVALAISCGVDTIEHGNGLDLDLAREMASRGIALVPTVSIFAELKELLEAGDGGMITQEQRVELLRASEQRIAEHKPALAGAMAAGVPIGLGTDHVPGLDIVAVHAEARALLSHQLGPLEVLAAATSTNARILGLDDRGVIRAGARADVAVFEGAVSSDLSLLQAPALVIQAGQIAVDRTR
jgi:imidazolonepropionase-like amidohydrolase